MDLVPIEEPNESPQHPTYSELMREREQLKSFLEPREKESESKDLKDLERLVEKEIDFIRQDKKRRQGVLEFFLYKELKLSSDLQRCQQELSHSKLMLWAFEQREDENLARQDHFITCSNTKVRYSNILNYNISIII